MIAAHLGISVVSMDSTEYAAAVADKARLALDVAGVSVSLAAKKSGIPRTTLDRKFNAGKGIQALTVRELYELATVSGTTAHDLAKVYSTPEETQHAKEASASA